MPTRWLKVLVLGTCLLLLGLLPYQSDLGWIDPVTGSMKSQTRIFLVPVSTVVELSAIEEWIVRCEGRHSRRWQFLHDTSSALLYGCAHGCGRAPEIYPLHAGESNEAFVRKSSDEEIAEFVCVMRSGTSIEKERAVLWAIHQINGWGGSQHRLPLSHRDIIEDRPQH